MGDAEDSAGGRLLGPELGDEQVAEPRSHESADIVGRCCDAARGQHVRRCSAAREAEFHGTHAAARARGDIAMITR
ncbi:hypothetical protein GCM10023238_13820 [Streptomyces heliomycini]